MYLAKTIAASGLRNQQMRIDTIAHNIANANTHGYKNARLDFKDALYVAGITPGPARSLEESQQKGHGLMNMAITRDFKPGPMERTERELDFAIEGEGFFSLSDPHGDVVYTRSGVFFRSVEANGIFLVNGQGLYVLDENGGRIQLPFETSKIEADVDGTLRFLDMNNNQLGQARLGIFTFRNIKGLETVGGGNFAPSPAAGQRFQVNDNITLRQGVLEGSNLNLAEEMTRVIRTQRAFQLASRALTTADEMQGIANNMRR
ncbi:MAG: flagellar hook-basal body protein [Oscillospiraceae bacterium]|nr:flagellar hook-basal body protein [Oscillospiraceae bacterium]